RNYLEGITAGLRRLGVRHCVLELADIWAVNKTEPDALVHRMSKLIVQQNIGAVLGYGFNGLSDIPPDGVAQDALKRLRTFWEIRGIPQMLLWLDHPHWHADLVGLLPELQAMFRSGNNYH